RQLAQLDRPGPVVNLGLGRLAITGRATPGTGAFRSRLAGPAVARAAAVAVGSPQQGGGLGEVAAAFVDGKCPKLAVIHAVVERQGVAAEDAQQVRPVPARADAGRRGVADVLARPAPAPLAGGAGGDARPAVARQDVVPLAMLVEVI